ncbi:laccase-21-like protein [Carex littledalei]|uniref:Laccase n=1 Tax=Carex littledalei TaxID=544730 RepID=A0A833RHL1_9POAL|nr:laccase-21-like protein [Carex littledalei]
MVKSSMLFLQIQEATYTRLCNNTKNILTVNGLYPGPTISARKGDIVYVKVINRGNKNITIHWHGVNQPRDPWSDGPEYITQCPIQPRANYTQRISFTEEEGTLWWHAHSEFDRATVHGAIVIYPKLGTTFPFRKPDKEFTLILGEWWNKNITDVYQTAVDNGGQFDLSDANTINGQPGDFMPCSANDTFKVQVEQGKTYLLRLINAALENSFFFAVSGHNVTLVGTDGSYTKPYVNEFVMITQGQTMDLLLQANQFQNSSSPYRYYIIAALYFDSNVGGPRDYNVTVAILEYKTNHSTPSIRPVLTSLPYFNDTNASAAFASGLRSLASSDHPTVVPQTVNVQMYITLSVNEQSCPNDSCAGVNGTRFAASMNNASFQSPKSKIDVLDAYYNSIAGVYTTDFPDQPPLFFNFTGDNIPEELYFVDKSTKVKVLEYNTTVEIVFQGTNMAAVMHPVHLHGHSFYVIGRGLGNFNNKTDPLSYNLVDPPFESTVGVPMNGWATIRFRAANPGVWYMHCHNEEHAIWGMDVVFITKNGYSTEAKIVPPPADKPPC